MAGYSLSRFILEDYETGKNELFNLEEGISESNGYYAKIASNEIHCWLFFYSFRKASTGFIEAAFITLLPTVAIAINKNVKPENKNNQIFKLMWYVQILLINPSIMK
jgi:hypothetical protein